MLSLFRNAIKPSVLSLDVVRAFTTSSVSLKKKADPTLPTPPKGPSSPYALFFKEFFGRERENFLSPETGKLRLPDVAKAAGSAWFALSDSDKEPFARASRASHAAYESAYHEFYNALTPETRKAIEKASGKKLHVPGGKVKARKEFRDRPGNPGKPSSSFFEFLKHTKTELEDEVAGLEGIAKHTRIASIAGQRWRALSASEKEVWTEKMKKARLAYDEWLKTQ